MLEATCEALRRRTLVKAHCVNVPAACFFIFAVIYLITDDLWFSPSPCYDETQDGFVSGFCRYYAVTYIIRVYSG